MPNLGGETEIKYQITRMSTALISITKMCDAEGLDYGNPLVLERPGGMSVTLETDSFPLGE